MPTQVTYPGVYVQELPTGTHTIAGVATSVAAFLGYAATGPEYTPVQCLNLADFERSFGALDTASPLTFQISQFFMNGGSEAWVSRLPAPPTGFDIAGSSDSGTGVYAFDTVEQINLIVVPDMSAMDTGDYLTAATATLNYASKRRAFAILDLPAAIATPADAATWAQTTPASFGTGITNAAAYFPQVQVPAPGASDPIQIGACGTMAGIYAATDIARGVWKAPAGIEAALAGVEALTYVMNDQDNGVLNPLGINALRNFPVYGNIAWGARTLAAPNPADDDWKYISVRRLALYIEQSLIQGLQWTVFEPNDEALWAQIRLATSAFLSPLFLQGAFVGASQQQAFQCICDASTTTQEDVDNGIVNLVVMFAPVKPAEFVVINLQLTAGQAST